MSTTVPHSQNWVYLDIARAVEQVGDLETLHGMLPMLQELLERDLPQIERLLVQDDVRAANQILHSLKGCMPIFCVPALCEHLIQVEQMSKTDTSTQVGAAYVALGPKLRLLQQEVALYLSQS